MKTVFLNCSKKIRKVNHSDKCNTSVLELILFTRSNLRQLQRNGKRIKNEKRAEFKCMHQNQRNSKTAKSINLLPIKFFISIEQYIKSKQWRVDKVAIRHEEEIAPPCRTLNSKRYKHN